MENNAFVVKLATANINVINEEVLPLIEDEFARIAAANSLVRLTRTIEILADENPNNKEQLLELWSNLGNDPELVNAFKNFVIKSADKLENEDLVKISKALSEPLTKTIAALVDNVKPNDEQIKQIWLDFVKTEEFRTLVVDNIEWVIKAIIKNQTLEDYIIKLVRILD